MLAGKILTLVAVLSQLDHNWSCWASAWTWVLHHRAVCRTRGPWCLLSVGKWWKCGFVFRARLREGSHSLKNKLSENLITALSSPSSDTDPGLSQWRPPVSWTEDEFCPGRVFFPLQVQYLNFDWYLIAHSQTVLTKAQWLAGHWTSIQVFGFLMKNSLAGPCVLLRVGDRAQASVWSFTRGEGENQH